MNQPTTSTENSMFQRWLTFSRRDLWLLNVQGFPWGRRIALSLLKIVLMVLAGLKRNRCTQEASALTFISLMSLIPLLAFVFSLAKGLNAQEILLRSIDSQLKAMPGQISDFIRQIFELVNNTNFTTLGVIGLGMLFGSVIKVLGTVEKTFNSIWGVTADRRFMRKLSDYLLAMLLGPVIIMLSSTVIASVFSDRLVGALELGLGRFFVIYQFVFGFSGILGIIVAFAFLYGYLPNTEVELLPALGGGIVAGTIWYGTQWAYVKFQVGITSYNAIYGAFASLPIFLLWMYGEWLIVLLGAECSFALQNHKSYLPAEMTAEISMAAQLRLATVLVGEICRPFANGSGPWRPEQIPANYGLPIRVVQQTVELLQRAGIVLAAKDGGYVPALDPAKLTLGSIYQAVMGDHRNRFLAAAEIADQPMVRSLDQVERQFVGNLERHGYSRSPEGSNSA